MRMKSRKLKKTSFLKNVAILVVAHVFIKIIGIVNKIYLTNREGFGDEGNAIYSSAFQVYALFLTITSVGIPNAVSKLVSERLAIGDSKGAHKVFKIAVISFGMIGFLASLILFKFSHYITCTLIQIPETELSLIALSPSIFFVAITSVVKGYFNGRENLNVGANSQTVEQIFKTIITVVLIEIIAPIMAPITPPIDTQNASLVSIFLSLKLTIIAEIAVGIKYNKFVACAMCCSKPTKNVNKNINIVPPPMPIPLKTPENAPINILSIY